MHSHGVVRDKWMIKSKLHYPLPNGRMLESGAVGPGEGGTEEETLRSDSSSCGGREVMSRPPTRGRGLYHAAGLASSRTTAPSTSSPSSPSSPPPSPPDGSNQAVEGGDKSSRSDENNSYPKKRRVEDDGRDAPLDLLGVHPFFLSSLSSSSAPSGPSPSPSSPCPPCSDPHRSPVRASSSARSRSSSQSSSCSSSSSPSPHPPLGLASSFPKAACDVSRAKIPSALCIDVGESPGSFSFFMSVFFASSGASCSSRGLLGLLLEYLPLSSLLFSLLPCSRTVFRITASVFAESKSRDSSPSRAFSCCSPASASLSVSPVPPDASGRLGQQPSQSSSSPRGQHQRLEEKGRSQLTQLGTQRGLRSGRRGHFPDGQHEHQICGSSASLPRTSTGDSSAHSFLLASVTPHRSRRNLLLSKLVIGPSDLSLLHAKALPCLLRQGSVFAKGKPPLEVKEGGTSRRRVGGEKNSGAPNSPSCSLQAVSSSPEPSSLSERPVPGSRQGGAAVSRLWELELSCLSVQHWKRLKKRHSGDDGRAAAAGEEAAVCFPRVFFTDGVAGVRVSSSELNRHAVKVLRDSLLQGLGTNKGEGVGCPPAGPDKGEEAAEEGRKAHLVGWRWEAESAREAKARELCQDRKPKSPSAPSSTTSWDIQEAGDAEHTTRCSADSTKVLPFFLPQSSLHTSSPSPESTYLQSLVLSRCAISSGAFHSLCVLTLPLLRARLRSLHLVDCRLTAADASFLGYALLQLPLVEDLNLSNNLLGEEGGLIILLAILSNHRSRPLLEHEPKRARQVVTRAQEMRDERAVSSYSSSVDHEQQQQQQPKTEELSPPRGSSPCASSPRPFCDIRHFSYGREHRGEALARPPQDLQPIACAVEELRAKGSHGSSLQGSDASGRPSFSSASCSSPEVFSLQSIPSALSTDELLTRKHETDRSSFLGPPEKNRRGLDGSSPSFLPSSSPSARGERSRDDSHDLDGRQRSFSPGLSALNLSGNDISADNRLFLAILSHFLCVGSPPLRLLDLANNRFSRDSLFTLVDVVRRKNEREGRSQCRPDPEVAGTGKDGQGVVGVFPAGVQGEHRQTLKTKEEDVAEDLSVRQNHGSKEEGLLAEPTQDDRVDSRIARGQNGEAGKVSALLVDLRENFCACNRSSSGGGEDSGNSHARQSRGCLVALEWAGVEGSRRGREREGCVAYQPPTTGDSCGSFLGSVLRPDNLAKGGNHVTRVGAAPPDRTLQEGVDGGGSAEAQCTRAVVGTNLRDDESKGGNRVSKDTEEQENSAKQRHAEAKTEREDCPYSLLGEGQKGGGRGGLSEKCFVFLDACDCALAEAKSEAEGRERRRSFKDYYEALADTQKYQLSELLKKDGSFAERVVALCGRRAEEDEREGNRQTQGGRGTRESTEREDTAEEILTVELRGGGGG